MKVGSRYPTHNERMATSNPAYAILLSKVQRLGNLVAVGLHNGRLIPVPGADPSIKNGFKVIRLKGKNARAAVARRILQAGVRWPGRGRIWAVEIVLTFSDQADPMPGIEVLEKRGTAFLDGQYGEENVVAIWGHFEERTPHLQALVVPLAMAVAPGRPRNDEVIEPEEELAVSWRRFSGSDERDYRDPEKRRSRRRSGGMSARQRPSRGRTG